MFRFVTCKKLNSVQQFFFSQQDLDQWIIKIRLFRNHIVPYCSVQDPGQHTDYPNPLLHTLFPCCDRWAVQAWTSRGAAVTPCPPAAAAAAHGASPHTTPHLTTGRRRDGKGGGGVKDRPKFCSICSTGTRYRIPTIVFPGEWILLCRNFVVAHYF